MFRLKEAMNEFWGLVDSYRCFDSREAANCGGDDLRGVHPCRSYDLRLELAVAPHATFFKPSLRQLDD